MTGGIGKLIDRWRKPVPPVLVYQMGKVASTVHQSLSGAGVAVEQVQFLTETWIDQVTRQYRSAGAPIPENVRRSEKIAARIRTDPDQCQKVITLVRDPVACNISSLFETADPLHPDLILPDGSVNVPAAIEELLRQIAAFDESTD